MPGYRVDVFGSGESRTFKSIPALLKFVNEVRDKSKRKRNIGPKYLKKILAGNGVFDNTLRIVKELKGDKVSSSSSSQVSDGMDVDTSGDAPSISTGDEQPEKPLPFKTRRAKKKQAQKPAALEVQVEETVKAVEDKGNAPDTSKDVQIPAELPVATPQKSSGMTATRRQKKGMARGRVTQKVGALYKHAISPVAREPLTMWQAFESLKKSLAGLGTASMDSALMKTAAKYGVTWDQVTQTLQAMNDQVQRDVGKPTNLTFTPQRTPGDTQQPPTSLDSVAQQIRFEDEVEEQPANVYTQPTPDTDTRVVQPPLTIGQLATDAPRTQGAVTAAPAVGDAQGRQATAVTPQSLGQELAAEQTPASDRTLTNTEAREVSQALREATDTTQPDLMRQTLARNDLIGKIRELDDRTFALSSRMLEPEVTFSGRIGTLFQQNLDARNQLQQINIELVNQPPPTEDRLRQLVEEVDIVEELLNYIEETLNFEISGNGSTSIRGGSSSLSGDMRQQIIAQEQARLQEQAQVSAPPTGVPLNMEAPGLEQLYPLTETNLANLGVNAAKDYHELRAKLAIPMEDVTQFLSMIRTFSLNVFNQEHVRSALQGSLLEVAQSYRDEPHMYAKYVVHLFYFVLKNKVRLSGAELSKVEMGLVQNYAKFYGQRAEVEDNSIVSHIRLMVNEAAGKTIEAQPYGEPELIQGAGALDSIEAGMKTLQRSTTNAELEKEVVARRRMHRSKRRGMVLFEPGKSNLATQARLAPFKTPLDPELRRPQVASKAPTQFTSSVPRVSRVFPGAPQQVTVPQAIPTLVGDERPEAFSRDGAAADLARSDRLNTINLVNSELSRTLAFGAPTRNSTFETPIRQTPIPPPVQPQQETEEPVEEEGEGMRGAGAAMNQTELRRRRGITLFSDDAHERRAHKRLRASFTLNMWKET